MKFSVFILTLITFITFNVSAQDIDTIPIETKGLNIRLKRNPLPTRTLPLYFEPVKIEPYIVKSKVNYWKTKNSITFNVNQASFSDNWKNGGVNSLAIGGIVNTKAEYSKNDYSYVTEFILQYGKVRNKNQLQKKTNDRIYWDHKVSLQMSKNWYFFGSLNFESQFDNGYTYSKNTDGSEKETLISKFMGPGYLTQSLGFEYKPNKFFSTRIGTGTARQTFVLDTNLYKTNPKNFGVAHGKKFKNEIAFQIVTAYEKEILQNIHLKTRYAMFIPYHKISFLAIDHRLDVAITARINRFMNTSITSVVLYDKDMDAKIQASQTLALGFNIIFPR